MRNSTGAALPPTRQWGGAGRSSVRSSSRCNRAPSKAPGSVVGSSSETPRSAGRRCPPSLGGRIRAGTQG